MLTNSVAAVAAEFLSSYLYFY